MSSELTPQEQELHDLVDRSFDESSAKQEIKGITIPSLVAAAGGGVVLPGTFRKEGRQNETNLTLMRIDYLEQGTQVGVFERSIREDFDAAQVRALLRPSGCYKAGEWLRSTDKEVDDLRKDIELTEWDVAYAAYYVKRYSHKQFPPYLKMNSEPEE